MKIDKYEIPDVAVFAGAAIFIFLLSMMFWAPSSQVIDISTKTPQFDASQHAAGSAPVSAGSGSQCPSGQVLQMGGADRGKCVTPIDPIGDFAKSPYIIYVVMGLPILLFMTRFIRLRGDMTSLMIAMIGMLIVLVIGSSVISQMTTVMSASNATMLGH